MTMSGDRMSGHLSGHAPVSVAAAPIAVAPRPGAATSAAVGSTAARPPWWCAHRSRSSALGVLSTAALVCLASVVAVVGFVSTGSTLAALVALGVLAVGAANVVSGSFGAAWWARRARTSQEVTSMNTTDDRRPGGTDTHRGGDLPRRPTPVVPAAREPRTPASGGRHAWSDPADEPTTRIPTPPPPGHAGPRPPAPTGARPPGLAPVPTVGPPAPGPTDPTEALPTQHPGADEPDDRPASSTGTVRAAAKRAAARPTSRVKKVAGRPPGSDGR